MGFLMTFYYLSQEVVCDCTCVCLCEMYLYLIVHKHRNKHQLNQFLLSCGFNNCIVADLQCCLKVQPYGGKVCWQ